MSRIPGRCEDHPSSIGMKEERGRGGVEVWRKGEWVGGPVEDRSAPGGREVARPEWKVLSPLPCERVTAASVACSVTGVSNNQSQLARGSCEAKNPFGEAKGWREGKEARSSED